MLSSSVFTTRTWGATPIDAQLSGIPYQHAMSAEELLQELLCQRLEQDFQLLRPRNMSKLVTLRKEQTYYLSQGSQVGDAP